MESLCLTVLVTVLITAVSSSRPSQFPGAVAGPDGKEWKTYIALPRDGLWGMIE